MTETILTPKPVQRKPDLTEAPPIVVDDSELTQAEIDRDDEEWDELVTSPETQAWLTKMVEEVDHEHQAGLTTPGGWDE